MDDEEIAIITISSIVILIILYFLLEKKGVLGFFRKIRDDLKYSGKKDHMSPRGTTRQENPKSQAKTKIRAPQLNGKKNTRV
tara:strand:+ start:528 stop:773 length:246 start_codon:yes stop_codon:yes gene_type:complete